MTRTPQSRLPSGAIVRGTFFVALVAWALAAGKEVSWDLINHQFYLPFSWLSGRHETDLFAAGPQAYQNPLGYFPMYALIRAGLPAWIIGVLLGATHALVVWPLDRIVRLFWPGAGDEDFWFRLLALAFCCTAPILLFNVGNTSTDPITALFIVWATAFTLEAGLADAEKPGDTRRAAVAGLLLGLASAIKLSNAVPAIVLGLLWVMKWALGQVAFRRVAAFGAGIALAFAAGAGWWMAWLWRDFGNPIFPLYNNVFHSPYAPLQPMTAERFVPTGMWGIVRRLWEMTSFNSYVMFEDFLPDGRPLLAAIAALAAAAVIVARGRWRLLASRAAWTTPGAQLAIYLLLGYVLWMRSSGNARYAIAFLLLVGVALVRAAQRALPFSAAKVLLLTTLILQTGNYVMLGSHRFDPMPWDNGVFFEYRVPERLRTQPFLHLAIGTQSYAAIAPFLAPDGALTNPIGGFALPTQGPLGDRLEALMNRWHGRTRILFAAHGEADSTTDPKFRAGVRSLLYRLGIDADWNDCERIELVDPAGHPAKDSDAQAGPVSGAEHQMHSCAIVYRTDKDPVADAQLVTANKVFAILEAACPRALAPVPFASEHGNGVEQRHYLNSELGLTVSVTDGVSITHFRSLQPMNYGSIDDVLNHRNPIRCPVIENQTPR